MSGIHEYLSEKDKLSEFNNYYKGILTENQSYAFDVEKQMSDIPKGLRKKMGKIDFGSVYDVTVFLTDVDKNPYRELRGLEDSTIDYHLAKKVAKRYGLEVVKEKMDYRYDSYFEGAVSHDMIAFKADSVTSKKEINKLVKAVSEFDSIYNTLDYDETKLDVHQYLSDSLDEYF